MIFIINYEIFYGQDSNIVQDNIKKEFDLNDGDTRYKKKEQLLIYDFVGFILTEKKILAVFPKHYFSNEEIETLNQRNKVIVDDIKLLFDVILQYIDNIKSTAKAKKYLGNDPEYEADYPFAAFFSIYDYFKKYGIYQEKTSKTVAGYSGKISWKDTIRKSSKVVSNGNLIHIPLFVNKNKKNQVFVSECMAFVIDYTLENFPYFLTLPRTNYNISNFNFFENREYVLGQLRKAKNETFKDIPRKLINELIEFFEDVDINFKGGNIHIKINYFDKIWEKMVEKYLNDYFVKIDKNTCEMIFDFSNAYEKIIFKEQTFEIDKSSHKFIIIPDHYAIYKGDQFIFDSKYYEKINELNYKQLSYYNLLKNNIPEENETFNALILPGNQNARLHFELANKFIKENQDTPIIIEQYLDVSSVMKNYIRV